MEGISPLLILEMWSRLCQKDQVLISELTRRELEVLGLILLQKNLHQIAEQLNISYHTVRFHTKNITGKTGLSIQKIKERLLPLALALVEQDDSESTPTKDGFDRTDGAVP